MLVLLGGIGWISFVDTLKMKRAISWVDHTIDVTQTLKELELDLRESESALRNYIITGDASQIDEYRKQAFGETQQHLRRLQVLTKGDPDQQLILARLGPQVEKRVGLMENSRRAYENSVPEADLQKKLDHEVARITNDILVNFAEFIQRDNLLLETQIAARESQANLVSKAILASGALGLACVSASLYSILRGLRQRRQVGKELALSLEEKETLLKEVHHRVKNNLQVISSLLSLQSEKVKNAEAQLVFKECRDRIHLMARLHQRLYAQGQFASVDFGEHLQETAAMLVRAHQPGGCQVTLETQSESLHLDLDRAITLGLIANELILNSLKHAFKGQPAGVLKVELSAGAEVEMRVCDDGSGFPGGFNPENHGSLGMELVHGLARQLHGQVEFCSQPGGGTQATVRFPINPTSKES